MLYVFALNSAHSHLINAVGVNVKSLSFLLNLLISLIADDVTCSVRARHCACDCRQSSVHVGR